MSEINLTQRIAELEHEVATLRQLILRFNMDLTRAVQAIDQVDLRLSHDRMTEIAENRSHGT